MKLKTERQPPSIVSLKRGLNLKISSKTDKRREKNASYQMNESGMDE